MSRKYATDAERRQARLESWRSYYRRRRADYFELCQEHGEKPKGGAKWTAHWATLRGEQFFGPEENRELWQNTDCPYRRWWLSRFTLSELAEIASGL